MCHQCGSDREQEGPHPPHAIRTPGRPGGGQGGVGLNPISAEYPLLQLRNLVVFPRAVATVTLPRASSIAALDEAADRENRIVVATRRPIAEDGNEETGVYEIATLAEIIQV